MKDIDPLRLELAAYPVVRELTTRVSDLDGYGHLNAIRLGHFYEDARAAFYYEAFEGAPRARTLVAQITLRYLREGFWPAPSRVGTGIATIGTSSFVMAQGLFQEGRCIGLCDTVLVSTHEGRAHPLDGDIRLAIERMRLRQPEGAG
jgi:acyl-CoA thioester hydrolase